MAQSIEKKKVLFAITKSNWGGAQRYVYDLATHLPKDGFEVVVAYGGNGVMAQKLHKAGIRTIEIPGLGRDVHPLSDFASFRSLLRAIRDEKPQILHLNSSKVGLLGSLAGRCAGIPRIVFTAHGWPFNEDRPLLQRLLFRAFAHCTILFAHTTIAVSGAVALAISPRNARKKIVVIKNGVAPGSYIPKNEARVALVPQRSENEFWFGTIAELHPVKGLTYAIDAFCEHASLYTTARFVIIGEGEERSRLEAQIQASGFADKIHLAGFHEEASRYLRAFDVFILPSLSEGLSYVLLEAGAAGTPVIATHAGSIPEIIRDGESGILVPPRNARALAAAFARMQNDPTYRESLASTLHTRIERDFSLRNMVEKTIVHYR